MSFKTASALILCLASFGAPLKHRSSTFESDGRKIEIDEYTPRGAKPDAAIVLVHGSGGLHSSGFPYSAQTRFLAAATRAVYLPHYLDATNGSPREPARHYGIWAQAVRDALSFILSRTAVPLSRTVVVGYSLGASIALAAAAQEPRLAGVIVWSGSLPDAYRDVTALPPLLILHGARDPMIPLYNARQLSELCALKHFRCELQVFPDEGHAFSPAAIESADQRIEAFLQRVLRPR